MLPVTVLPDRREQQLATHSATASTAHKSLRRQMGKRATPATSDDTSTVTSNTHTHKAILILHKHSAPLPWKHTLSHLSHFFLLVFFWGGSDQKYEYEWFFHSNQIEIHFWWPPTTCHTGTLPNITHTHTYTHAHTHHWQTAQTAPQAYCHMYTFINTHTHTHTLRSQAVLHLSWTVPFQWPRTGRTETPIKTTSSTWNMNTHNLTHNCENWRNVTSKTMMSGLDLPTPPNLTGTTDVQIWTGKRTSMTTPCCWTSSHVGFPD